MIYQLTEGLNPRIREFGCYFMALLCAASRETLQAFDVRRVEMLYDEFVRGGAMTEKCFVLRPDTVMKFFDLPHRYTGEHAPPGTKIGSKDIEILYYHYNGTKSGYKPWYHFTLGNGRSMTEYDPWPRSVTANEGELLSKRIFKA